KHASSSAPLKDIYKEHWLFSYISIKLICMLYLIMTPLPKPNCPTRAVGQQCILCHPVREAGAL
uniref:Uncharacterized protein n=1 Tax=Myotis lucifugus TaxID=59463 RepID=G1Q7U1_MYOLU